MTPVSSLTVGQTGTATRTVTPQDSARQIGSGNMDGIFATPMLIAVMEAAAVACVEQQLPDEYTSLGYKIDAQHVAATPIGMTVTAVAELTEISGRKLTYKIEAHDDQELIGTSTHIRIVVDRARFAAKLQAKMPETH